MPNSRPMCFSDALSAHVRRLRRLEYAPGTIDLRTRYVRGAQEWLAHRGVDILSPDLQALRDWQDSLTPLAVRTRASRVSHLRAFYTWAASVDLCDGRALAVLERPRLPALLPHPIPDADLAVALANPPARIRPWLLLAAYAGLRCCEIAQVNAADLNLGRRQVLVHGKGRRERIVTLGQTLVHELKDCRLPQRGWLHPALSRTGQPLPRPVARNQVSLLGSRYLHDTGSDYTMHALRHHFGTELYRATRDIMLVRDQMGHASVKTTEAYLGLVDDRASAGADQISARLRRAPSPVAQTA